jgi:hypothetical protein
MPTKEEILNEKTFKGEGRELEERVYRTLTEADTTQTEMMLKALSFLIKHLYEKSMFSDEEIDEFLFQVVS